MGGGGLDPPIILVTNQITVLSLVKKINKLVFAELSKIFDSALSPG